MSKVFHIGSSPLTLDKVQQIISNKLSIELSKDAIKKINLCRNYLDTRLKKGGESIYGINTGFGSLCDVKISDKDIDALQENLVMSHACGTGELVPKEIIKLMLLLKIESLALGNSGIRLETVQRLINFYNHDVLPVIYEMGSLGASGDLAPLAHLSLPLLGKGEVYYKNKREKTTTVLKKLNWKPITLKSKEGLALLNGTQFMSAYGAWSTLQAKKISNLADLIASISLDAYDCRTEPFNELIHKVRPYKGQIESAKNIRAWLKGSKIASQKKSQIQDPYSFRCIPQVHGAARQVIDRVQDTFEIEINSVTDNPLIFPKEDKIISGGNFHGEMLALDLDYLGNALAELGNISERRTFQLVSGKRNLPEFLVAEAGLNSGLMIPQYTAASLVSQNKQLCAPASVDSITSSNGQEDHVSMGANAATKVYRIIENVKRILAIELLTASQAIEFRRPLKSSPQIEKLLNNYRKKVSFIKKDRILHDDIENSLVHLQTIAFDVII